MITQRTFTYTPHENEAEKASNSYLMSLIALMGGLPFPIVNLIATFFFYIGNRKGSYFVRWHCTQALLSQISVVAMNGAGVYWTIQIILGDYEITNDYIAYIITIIAFNVTEFIATIYTAIKTREGKHIEWWFYGPLTNMICKEK